MPPFQTSQLVHAENMKPRYPLMTLDVLPHSPMSLISEILTDTSGSISQEMMGVFQGGEGWGERRMEVSIGWGRG
jgi:hypothetical protein